MDDDLITFGVACPQCGQQWTTTLARSQIADSLDRKIAIRVYAQCHDESWDLSKAERESLARRIGFHRGGHGA